MTNLQPLIQQVGEATGASRELDALLWPLDPGFTRTVTPDSAEVSWRRFASPTYTASVDAALALLETKRKEIGCYGWTVELDDEPVVDPYYVTLSISRGFPSDSGCFKETHRTPALALILAILTALSKKDDAL